MRVKLWGTRGSIPTPGPATVRYGGNTSCVGVTLSDGTLPDHEPALAGPLAELDPAWLSGYALARDADLLLHDCQYTDAEYPSHFGWGHSSLSDALTFARRTNARHTLLFHHDPRHSDDDLDALLRHARERWEADGGAPGAIEMAAEPREIELGAASAPASAP